MKRPIFIIASTILVLVLLIVWVYVLFFASPKEAPSIFTNFLGGKEDPTSITIASTSTLSTAPVVDVNGKERLRQLTTRLVAGFQEVSASSSSTPFIYYIEAGTGHIYAIDMTSGTERRLSATTFSVARKAAITPNGQFVFIQSKQGADAEFLVGRISTDNQSVVTKSLAGVITSFTTTLDNTFLYTEQTASSLIGKEIFPNSGITKTIFTIPFREAVVAWGEISSDEHLVYPKPSEKLEGYLYAVKAGVIKRLPIAGHGLTAVQTDTYAISTRLENEILISHSLNKTTGELRLLPNPVLTDKCTSVKTNDTLVLCANEKTTFAANSLEAWYKGEMIYNDDLWLFDLGSGSTTLLASVQKESGRQLDIVNLNTNSTDKTLYFLNKRDSTLWALSLDIQSDSLSDLTDDTL